MAGMKQWSSSFVKGINSQEDLALPGECLDALNVWAPDGIVVSRPGYQGLGFGEAQTATNTVDCTAVAKKHTGGGTDIVAAFPNTIAIDPWTPGTTRILVCFQNEADIRRFIALSLGFTASPITPANQSKWVGFYFKKLEDGTLRREPFNFYSVNENFGYTDVSRKRINLLSTSGTFCSQYICPPPHAGLATVTLSTGAGNVTRTDVAFEFLVVDRADAAGAVVIDTAQVAGYFNTGSFNLGAVAVRTASGVVLCNLHGSNAPTGYAYENYLMEFFGGYPQTRSASYYWPNIVPVLNTTTSEYEYTSIDKRQLISVASVPQFELVYVAHNGNVAEFKTRRFEEIESLSSYTLTSPGPETDPIVVGPGAPYDINYIAQKEFPPSNHVLFYDGRMWAADATTVYWSAPEPYFKVWPQLSFVQIGLVAGDRITGLVGFQNTVVVFTKQSIWQLVFSGVNSFGLAEYQARQVVAGVGTDSPHSIEEIKGRLIFLGENSIYAFDGRPQVSPLSYNEAGADRTSAIFSRLNKGYLSTCSATHWEEKNCYLVSLPLDGSTTNNHVLVWDYKQNAFWLWEMEVHGFFRGEQVGPPGTLMFVGPSHGYYAFGIGSDDYGAVVSRRVTSHLVGGRSLSQKTVRDFGIVARPQTRSATVNIYRNLEDTTSDTGTISFVDAAESDWDALDFGEDNLADQNRRRDRRIRFRTQARKFRLEVEQVLPLSESNQQLVIEQVYCTYIDHGDR